MKPSLVRAVVATVVTALLVTPLVPLIVWTFSDNWRYPALVPQQTSLRGLRLLTAPANETFTGLLASLAVSLTVTLLALLIGVPAGRALGLYHFPCRGLVQFVLLLPALVPTLAALLGTQVVLIHYGIADTTAGVVLALLLPSLPYVVMVAASAFASYDIWLEGQARVLGATPLLAFWRVTVPTLRSPLLVAAYLAFLVSWSDYAVTLLVGGGTVKTLPLLLFGYLNGSDLTQAAAVALLLVLPPALLFAALRQHIRDVVGARLTTAQS